MALSLDNQTAKFQPTSKPQQLKITNLQITVHQDFFLIPLNYHLNLKAK